MPQGDVFGEVRLGKGETGREQPQNWALDPGGGETFSGGGSGYGEGPPDGSNQIKVVYRGKHLGHQVQILAKGKQLGIKVGDKFQVVEFPDVNQMVLAAAALTKRVSV